MATLKEMMAVWLATKDPNETYDWRNGNWCACGQFANASDKRATWFNRYEVNSSGEELEWQKLDRIAFGDKWTPHWTHEKAQKEDWTFGAMLKRIKETA